MRIGIVSDIHSNLAAFEAVLSHMGPVDMLWCLGDVVGYGPDPNECVELLRRHDHICVLGNHDAAVIGKLDTSDFNPAAATAANWTAGQLSERSRDYLLALPETVTEGQITIVHGSPREPIWEYIVNDARAAANFSHFKTTGCLVGHTHIPALYVESRPGHALGTVPADSNDFSVGPTKFIANPGSVGQPRDNDSRAAYAIYDSNTNLLEWRRVEYPIEVTQQRMRQFGLPDRLIQRLSFGY